MAKQAKDRDGKSHSQTQRSIIISICGLLVIIVLAVIVFLLMQPQRTVANFCKVADGEKSVLTGNVNDSLVLDAYKKLETVAPSSIAPDVTETRKGYESIVANPSSTLSTGFGIAGAQNRINTYLQSNCSSYKPN